ncbi:MAG: S9 family peptidase [Bacteroidales bacterium]
MKTHRIIIRLLVLLIATPIFAQKEITLEDIWSKGQFRPGMVQGIRSMNDGKNFTRLNMTRNSILMVDYETGKNDSVIFKLSDFEDTYENDWIFDYTFSIDENLILIATGHESIYRHSYKAKFHIYNRKNNSITPVSKENKIQAAVFSPEGNYVSYVFDNNMYLYDIKTGQTTQITYDGEKNKILNGIPDWVYEEEFSFAKAYTWSKNSQYIAFLKTDESAVKEYSMPIYGELYPQQYKYKYPKAGEKNSEVSVHIYDIQSGETQQIKLNTEGEFYVPRIYQTARPSVFAIVSMNRLQNEYNMHKVNAATGEADIILSLHAKNYIELHDDVTFLPDGEYFVMTHSESGFRHLYRYNMNGELQNQITSGNWEVTDFYGYDPNEELYYYQSTEPSPLQRNVYAINKDGKQKKKLNEKPGTTTFKFSKGYKYYIEKHTDANTPLTVSLHRKNTELVRMLEENKGLKETMEDYSFQNKEFFTLKAADGETDLNAWMIKPPDFNKRKSYPVLIYTYGGPGSQTVADAWDHYNAWWQLLAQKGYIIVSIDNRGTGFRGRDFKQITYKELGKYETEDLIASAKQLAARQYIDGERIGIFGWSFGGYLTNLCLTKGAAHFKAGIAVAPVTNWRYYDTIYTERYNGLPDDNASGYDDNSPINHAGKLEGKLLLVHGTADDNVHFQNSMDYINKLVAANKDFEMMVYPNRDHGIYGGNATLHLYTKMTDFLIKNL